MRARRRRAQTTPRAAPSSRQARLRLVMGAIVPDLEDRARRDHAGRSSAAAANHRANWCSRMNLGRAFAEIQMVPTCTASLKTSGGRRAGRCSTPELSWRGRVLDRRRRRFSNRAPYCGGSTPWRGPELTWMVTDDAEADVAARSLQDAHRPRPPAVQPETSRVGPRPRDRAELGGPVPEWLERSL
jgi:hypothetical protein